MYVTPEPFQDILDLAAGIAATASLDGVSYYSLASGTKVSPTQGYGVIRSPTADNCVEFYVKDQADLVAKATAIATFIQKQPSLNGERGYLAVAAAPFFWFEYAVSIVTFDIVGTAQEAVTLSRERGIDDYVDFSAGEIRDVTTGEILTELPAAA
jgi:hypothetical protein